MHAGDDAGRPPPDAGDTTSVSDFAVVSAGSVLADTYRLVRRIAMGGMGVVFEAEHLRLGGHRVAVKVMLPEVASQPEVLARFRREAEILARLQHPHIVRVSDFNALPDGTPFFVMEYLDGASLAFRMDQEPIPAEQALRILHQIASALDAAHAQGIVHRDLKPSNVFLAKADPAADGQGPVAKILDFGISRVLGEQTLHAGDPKIYGSPRYMSPEQAEGRNHEVGPAADQFSLAAISCELLSGQRAFAGATPAAVLYRVVHGEPEGLDVLAERYPPAVSAAIRRALHKDPARRHPSVGAFDLALQDGMTSAAFVSAPSPAGDEAVSRVTGDMEAPLFDERPTTLLKRRPRRRWGRLLVVAFVVAVAGGSLWLYPRLAAIEPAPSVPGQTARAGTTPRAADPGAEPAAAGLVTAQPIETGPGTDEPTSPVAEADTTEPVVNGPAASDAKRDEAPGPDEKPAPVAPEADPAAAARRADRLLDQARIHYDLREFRDTIHKARASLKLAPTGRAHVLITLSHCQLGEAEQARNALALVPPARRPDTLAQCIHLGTDPYGAAASDSE